MWVGICTNFSSKSWFGNWINHDLTIWKSLYDEHCYYHMMTRGIFQNFSQMRCLLHQKEKVKNDGVSTIGDAYHIKIRQIQNIDSLS